MDSSSYILKAAAAEESCGIAQALSIAQAGYGLFPDNYELVFMLGNYSFYSGNPELAYVYYLLAESLCDTGDKPLISENRHSIPTDSLDAEKVRSGLSDVIAYRFKLREYEKTYAFVSDILFSEDRFLFQKISDYWLRYYLIILEITSCEKNRGLTEYTADRYADWRAFEQLLREFKFAFRRIWFGFSQEQQRYLYELAVQSDVSAEFIVIMGKYSVHADFLSAALKRAADIFSAGGQTLTAEIILFYANWFSEIHNANQPLPPAPEAYDNHMTVLTIDASRSYDRPEAAGKRNAAPVVSYIMCANDQRYVEEVLLYLRRQRLPADRAMTVSVVYHAPGMAAGYNIAMRLSDAPYKIYIHQDTFIFDTEYTCKLIEALTDSDYDMLGIAGTSKMPPSGRWWDSRGKDAHLCLYQDFVISMLRSVTEPKEEGLLDVQCIDGVLIATKQDVIWREDLFTDFHFYDISQSYEFAKRSFKVGIYRNQTADCGVLHEVSVSKNRKSQQAYEDSREVFLRSYLPSS